MKIKIELTKKSEILADGLRSTGDFTKYDIFEKPEIDSFRSKLILKVSIEESETTQVIAEAALLPSRCSTSWVNRGQVLIYVKPEFHGKGVGSQLIAEIIKQSRILSLHYLFASIKFSNLASKALFKKFGFEENGLNPEFFDGEKLICNKRFHLPLKDISID
jgi:RimJ/RimL family protein N-acetyltransferase